MYIKISETTKYYVQLLLKITDDKQILGGLLHATYFIPPKYYKYYKFLN